MEIVKDYTDKELALIDTCERSMKDIRSKYKRELQLPYAESKRKQMQYNYMAEIKPYVDILVEIESKVLIKSITIPFSELNANSLHKRI